MAIAHIVSGAANALTSGASGGPTTVTSPPVNTTGADFLVCVSVWYNPGVTPTISDNKGNSWTSLTTYSSTNSEVRLSYSAGSPTVGANHTFTAAGGSSTFPAIGYAAFSGVGSSPFHSQNGATTASASSLSTGSVTPSVNGALIIAGLDFYTGSSVSIGSGFSASGVNYSGSVALACGIAYLIQSTAASVNPSWSWTGTNEASAAIAVFLPPVTAGGRIIGGGIL